MCPNSSSYFGKEPTKHRFDALDHFEQKRFYATYLIRFELLIFRLPKPECIDVAT
jgi:hypothetical protein